VGKFVPSSCHFFETFQLPQKSIFSNHVHSLGVIYSKNLKCIHNQRVSIYRFVEAASSILGPKMCIKDVIHAHLTSSLNSNIFIFSVENLSHLSGVIEKNTPFLIK